MKPDAREADILGEGSLVYGYAHGLISFKDARHPGEMSEKVLVFRISYGRIIVKSIKLDEIIIISSNSAIAVQGPSLEKVPLTDYFQLRTGWCKHALPFNKKIVLHTAICY